MGGVLETDSAESKASVPASREPAELASLACWENMGHDWPNLLCHNVR